LGKRILVVGGGGRESALCYGLNASSVVEQVFITPGNAGTAILSKVSNVEIKQEDTAQFCLNRKIDLVVIGPDAPVVSGLADDLRQKNIVVFGPSKAAARLEGSKSFATEFMKQNSVPLPPSKITSDEKSTLAAIKSLGGFSEVVIKADGLAGGKGVFLPDSNAEAKKAVKDIVSGEVDGIGNKLVVQQRYHGPEVSIFVLSDGKNFKIIPIATQDHKRIGVGDKGPMTGGMGAYTPLPEWMLGNSQWGKIADIAKKTITGMLAQGNPYQGVLYMGLMLAEEVDGDPVVIEYNARFGDPETEVIIPVLVQNDVDIYEMLSAAASGALADYKLPTEIRGAAITICLASANYPAQPLINQTIYGLDKSYNDVLLFHGNTKKDDDNTLSSGGRVMFVTGLGSSLELASQAANSAIGTEGVHFHGMQYRSDIGHRVFQNRRQL